MSCRELSVTLVSLQENRACGGDGGECRRALTPAAPFPVQVEGEVPLRDGLRFSNLGELKSFHSSQPFPRVAAHK